MLLITADPSSSAVGRWYTGGRAMGLINCASGFAQYRFAERAEILREAFRRTFRDPEFHKEYRKLTGDDATPLLRRAGRKNVGGAYETKCAEHGQDLALLVAGRMFAYLIGLKDPKFIAGYTSQEVDAALTQGELDARANNAISVLRRNPEWLDKKLMNFHSIVEVPKGERHPSLGHLPEIETFAKSKEKEGSSACFAVSARSALPLFFLRARPRTECRYSKPLFAESPKIPSSWSISTSSSPMTHHSGRSSRSPAAMRNGDGVLIALGNFQKGVDVDQAFGQ